MEDDDVFDETEEELWSSPLMNHKSPFDDYKDLYADIPSTPTSNAFQFPASKWSPSCFMHTCMQCIQTLLRRYYLYLFVWI